MSDIFELGVGISFPEGDFTKDQVDQISAAFVNFQEVAKSTGAAVDPTMTALNSSLSDMSNSMADSMSFDAGGGLGAAFLGSLADVVTGVEDLGEAACESNECLDGTTDALQSAGNAAEAATPQVEGFGDALSDSTEGLADATKSIGSHFQKLESFGGGGASGTMLELEDASHKMAVGLGMAGDRAQYMRTEMLQLGATTQFSIGEITRLAGELSQTGRGLDEFGAGAQQNMIALNDIFGVSGQEIARTDRTMEAFGGSMEDQLDQAAMFQKQFQVPGVFAQLPGIVGHAQVSVVSFGKAVVGSGQSVMGNVTKTAGVFAKAYGKTMADSIGDAQAAFDRFATVAKTSRRVFLGLESDFDPLQKAFMEVGVPLWESSKIIEGATSDSETAILGFVDATRAKLKQLEGSPMGERFLEQLRDELPPAVMEAVTSVDRYRQIQEAATEAQRRQQLASVAGADSFEELSGEMLNTTKELKKMWFNVKQLVGATLVQTGVMDALKGAFRGAKDVVGTFAGSIENFVRSDGFQAWAERIKPVVAAVGKGVLLLGAAFGSVTATIGGLFAGKASLWGMSKALGVVGDKASTVGNFFSNKGVLGKGLGGVGRILSGLTGNFKNFGGWITKFFTKGLGKNLIKKIPGIAQVVAVIDGIATAFTDMGNVLGDPNASGMDKFAALFRGTVKGLVAFVDTALFGIPGWIANTFFPDMEKTFDEGWSNLTAGVKGFSLAGALKSAWNSGTEWLAEKLGGFSDWMASRLPDWSNIAKDWGRSIGGAIGGLGKMLVEGLIWMVKNLNPVAMIGHAVTFFKDLFSSGVKGGVESASPNMLSSAGIIVKTFGTVLRDGLLAVFDGIFGAFGMSLEQIKISGGLAFTSIAEKGFDMAAGLMGSLIKIGSFAGSAFSLMEDSSDHAWDVLQIGGMKALAAITKTFLGEGGFISSILSGFEKFAMAFGMNDMMMSINEARTGMEGFGTEAAAKIKAVEDAMADEVGMTDALAAAQKRANVAAAEGTADLIGYRDAMASTNKELQGQLLVADARIGEREKWNAATRDERDGLTDVLKLMSDKNKKDKSNVAFTALNAQAQASAADAFSDYMDTTIRNLSAGLRDGSMDAAQAIKALADAKIKGVKDTIAGVKKAQDAATGSDVAKSAAFDGVSPGMTPDMFKGIMVALNKGALARGRDVQVTLRGTDAISKEMARKSGYERLNAGNG